MSNTRNFSSHWKSGLNVSSAVVFIYLDKIHGRSFMSQCHCASAILIPLSTLSNTPTFSDMLLAYSFYLLSLVPLVPGAHC